MTFKYFLVAVLIGFIFYLLLLPRLDLLRKSAIFLVVLTMLVFAIQPDWSTGVAQRVGISRGCRSDLLPGAPDAVLPCLRLFPKLQEDGSPIHDTGTRARPRPRADGPLTTARSA